MRASMEPPEGRTSAARSASASTAWFSVDASWRAGEDSEAAEREARKAGGHGRGLSSSE